MARRKPQTQTYSNENDVKLLPHSADLESKVLGCIMAHPELFDKSVKFLNHEGLFYDDFHADLWGIMVSLHGKGKRPALATISAVFRSRGRSNEVPRLTQMVKVVGETYFMNWCLMLNEYMIRRICYRVGLDVSLKSLDDGNDPLSVLSLSLDDLGRVVSYLSGLKETSTAQAVKDIARDLVQIQTSGVVPGVPSSIASLDAAIMGYRVPNFVVIAASTGEGKSTLCYQEALYQAEQGIPVGIVSMEMSTKEVLLMMACGKLGYDYQNIARGRMSPEESVKLGTELTRIGQLPIYISETQGLTMTAVASQVRKWYREKGIRIAYLDHLHLIKPDNPAITNLEQIFTDIANRCKELAKELKIPIVALCQFARKDLQSGRLHAITDLKYAGGIEQAADVVMLIYRPEQHGIKTWPADTNISSKGKAEIIIGKIRMAPTSVVSVFFNGKKFFDLNDQPKEPIRPDNPYAGMPAQNGYKIPAGFQQGRSQQINFDDG